MRLRLMPGHRPVDEESPDQQPDAVADDVDASMSPGATLRGPDVLMDGPLFADWFVTFQLDMEMRRARRHERHLSILVLTPVPTLGASPSRDALEVAAAAAKESSRITDIIGWLPDDRILVILPETDRDGAAAATHRWRSQMYTRTMHGGALRWVVSAAVDASGFESAGDLLESLSPSVV